MGLISTNEVVTPIQIAINGVHTNPTYGQFTADGFETNTIAQLVARQGVRVPSVAAAQKTFRAMLVVLTTSALPASRLAQYDSDVGNFSLAGSDGLSTLNFWEATGGRAQLQMNELVPKPAVAPRLNALKQGTNLTLTWPESATGFILESTTALPPGLLWNPVIQVPELLGGQNVLSLPIFPGNRFYRLQK